MSAGERRRPALLWAGAVLGIGLAAFGVLRPAAEDAPPGPAGAVARVDGHPISREAFERLLDRARGEAGRPLEDAAEKRRLLERLIDEELLLRRGLELDLVRVDPEIRGALLRSVVGAIQGAAEVEAPDERTLQTFHREHAERFRAPHRVELEMLGVPIAGRSESGAYRLATTLARRARKGEALAGLGAELPDAQGPPLPPGPVPMDALADRLGRNLARVVADLVPGEVSDPVRGSDVWWLIRLLERTPARLLSFEEARERVREAWQRERTEAAVAGYLERARAEAEIRILEPSLRP